jgi:hypothetical protein
MQRRLLSRKALMTKRLRRNPQSLRAWKLLKLSPLAHATEPPHHHDRCVAASVSSPQFVPNAPPSTMMRSDGGACVVFARNRDWGCWCWRCHWASSAPTHTHAHRQVVKHTDRYGASMAAEPTIHALAIGNHVNACVACRTCFVCHIEPHRTTNKKYISTKTIKRTTQPNNQQLKKQDTDNQELNQNYAC